jgi:hypothetical protein
VKIHPIRLSLPKPSLGDVVFRENLSGQYEEATVAAIIIPNKESVSWTSTLLTRNGIEFIGSDMDFRSKHDWMPLGWYLSEDGSGWVEPDGNTSGLQGRLHHLEATVAALAAQVALLQGATEDTAEPLSVVEVLDDTVITLPEPKTGEKFMAWKSRAVKAAPVLKSTSNSSAILSAAWHSKSFENISVTA